MSIQDKRPRIGLYCLDVNRQVTSSIGLYNYARRIIKTFAEAPDPGFDIVLLLSSQNRSELLPSALPAWITCKSLRGDYSTGFRRIWADHVLSGILARSEDLQAMHFPKVLAPVFFPSSCRLICTIADTIVFKYDEISGNGMPFFRRKYFQWLTKRALRKADAVITISDYSKKMLLAVDRRKKIHVIYPSIGIECIAPFEITMDSKTMEVLILGSFAPHKATGETIRLLGLYASQMHTSISVNIASIEGPDPSWLPLPPTLNIAFFGRISDLELSQLMSSSRVFIYLSSLEGFGLPCIESYECGTPVCFRDSTSLAEIMKGIPGGWDGSSRESFFEAMDAVWNMPPVETSKYRELLRKRFNWKTNAFETFEIYRATISSCVETTGSTPFNVT